MENGHTLAQPTDESMTTLADVEERAKALAHERDARQERVDRLERGLYAERVLIEMCDAGLQAQARSGDGPAPQGAGQVVSVSR